MIDETLKKIEARVQAAPTLSNETRGELLRLLATLEQEVSGLSQTNAEQAQSIARFAEVSTHEAMRQQQHPELLQLSLRGFSTSVEDFEASHPKLVDIVNRICTTLASLGI